MNLLLIPAAASKSSRCRQGRVTILQGNVGNWKLISRISRDHAPEIRLFISSSVHYSLFQDKYVRPLAILWPIMTCVGQYANTPHAFTDIYALLKFICVFAYIYCVYLSLCAKKNLPDKMGCTSTKKIQTPLNTKKKHEGGDVTPWWGTGDRIRWCDCRSLRASTIPGIVLLLAAFTHHAALDAAYKNFHQILSDRLDNR